MYRRFVAGSPAGVRWCGMAARGGAHLALELVVPHE